MFKPIWKPTCITFVLLACLTPLARAELLIGAAVTSITPAEPVAVSGQFHLRIARNVESPVMANVIVLESRDGAESKDVAIMVACDLVYITDQVRSRVRDEVHQRLPDLDTSKVFLNAIFGWSSHRRCTTTSTCPATSIQPSCA